MPPSSPGQYLVAANSGSAYIRVEGLGSMNNCAPLQDFLEDLQVRGCRQFIFDLENCDGFDSTIMGIFISCVSFRAAGAQAMGRVILLNVDNEQRKLMSAVGVDRVVELCSEKVQFPEIDLRKLKAQPIKSERHLRRLVQAHENLVQLDSRNEARFGAFLDMVKKELARRP